VQGVALRLNIPPRVSRVQADDCPLIFSRVPARPIMTRPYLMYAQAIPLDLLIVSGLGLASPLSASAGLGDRPAYSCWHPPLLDLG